jgi:hypothetical protein
LTKYFGVSIITPKQERRGGFQVQVIEDSEISDLSDVYTDMDSDGKKTMVWMAKELLTVQLVGSGEIISPAENMSADIICK